MVARQLTPLFVADLDGTLVRGNTLHEFVRLGFRHGGARERLSILWWSLLRGMRVVGHATYKWQMARAIRYDSRFKEAFGHRISGIWNSEAQALLDVRQRQGCRVLIATAAFDFYVKEIARGPFVATAFERNPHRRECRGEAKADAIRRWADENGCFVAGAITDMPVEDAPMLSLAPQGERYAVDAGGRISRL